jgi:transposase
MRAGLEASASKDFARRQCHDIPPASVVVTETRWRKVACGCGFITAAAAPDDLPDAPYYQPNLAALGVYLLVYQHVPVQQCVELIRDVTGAQVSTGWVSSLLPRAARLVEGPNLLTRALLAFADVVHADETCTNVALTILA